MHGKFQVIMAKNTFWHLLFSENCEKIQSTLGPIDWKVSVFNYCTYYLGKIWNFFGKTRNFLENLIGLKWFKNEQNRSDFRFFANFEYFWKRCQKAELKDLQNVKCRQLSKRFWGQPWANFAQWEISFARKNKKFEYSFKVNIDKNREYLTFMS